MDFQGIVVDDEVSMKPSPKKFQPTNRHICLPQLTRLSVCKQKSLFLSSRSLEIFRDLHRKSVSCSKFF